MAGITEELGDPAIQGTTAETFHLAYSIMDSSRVSTFFISILLIVYGSFRSISMEEGKGVGEDGEDEKRREQSVTTLDSLQAMCLPLGASVSLLIMFFFFDSMQLLFAVCTAVIATVALAFLLLPMCQYLVRPCSAGKGKISLGMCGRFSLAELVSVTISVGVVCVWVLTGHWALMDFLGMGLCVAFIAFVRLPSLKVSTLLLTGLLLYDVFWVFFSQYVFSANVMVKVATRPAENPMGIVARKLSLGGSMARNAPRLSLPGKLVFPSTHNVGHFSMLGLGDIVMPGLLLCFVMRYDAYKKAQAAKLAENGIPLPSHWNRLSYFHCSLFGYFLGLLTATISSEVFKAAQPALLYLVPFTLLPLLTMAWLKGDLRSMWSEPFATQPPSKFQTI
ncbi:signal peptide peptidase-like 3 [Eurytemora carolleeae]|uniref:signal peptide peptidase-like 3 n=1 Tax=Eurytemora carolleeae TaxID=1294199 RepID=UPI000C76E6CC|nr:signal peptide peptidase-like 3 [Eurytemora carolleeae]|eukprot:XP_023337575.1 signal peptide peptidase-like 3 [Eurytemora affinis]